MSGGSFNYLCSKDVLDVFYGVGTEWDQMLEELDELCPEASAEMRKIREDSKTFEEVNGKRWSDLYNLLHAVEWWRSFDYGKHQVDEAIAEYRSKLANET